MKKIICLVLVLAFCVAFVCPVFAEGFTSSPGLDPDGCTHDFNHSVVGGFDASCVADGYSGDYVCDGCGAVVQYGKVIPAKGHNYVNGVCVDCHMKAPSPETGDNSMLPVWTVVLVVAVAGLVGLTTVYRKKCTHQ